MSDFTVADHGSIVVVTPTTPEAVAWVTDHVEVPDYSWFGCGFGVEHRYADAIIEGAAADGFTVEPAR